jgi:hypothetical protein
MGFRTWLKRRLLPYEFPDHPLYYNREEEKRKQDEALRAILGDEFVDRLNNF